jgi:predicted Zn-dependent protease
MTDTPPASPANSKTSIHWLLYLLAGGIFLGIWILKPLIFGPVSRLWSYLIALTFLFFIGKLLLWDQRKLDPLYRWYSLLVAVPASLAAVSFVLTGHYGFLLLAAIWIGAVCGWLRYFRFPTAVWPALQKLRARNYPEALQLINEVIRTQPVNWKYYQMRGSVQLAHQHLWEAEQDARRVIRFHPDEKARLALAVILIYGGRFDEARVEYQRALRLKPRSAEGNYGLGMACCRLEKYPEAIQALTLAARSTLPFLRQNLLAHYYLGRCLEATGQGQLANAAYAKMRKYRDGSEKLAQFIAANSEFPGIEYLRQDLAEIDVLFGRKCPKAQNPQEN